MEEQDVLEVGKDNSVVEPVVEAPVEEEKKPEVAEVAPEEVVDAVVVEDAESNDSAPVESVEEVG